MRACKDDAFAALKVIDYSPSMSGLGQNDRTRCFEDAMNPLGYDECSVCGRETLSDQQL